MKPLAIREGTPKLFARRVTARGRDVISPLLNNFCTMEQNERLGLFFVMFLLSLMLLCFVVSVVDVATLAHLPPNPSQNAAHPFTFNTDTNVAGDLPARRANGVADGFERST